MNNERHELAPDINNDPRAAQAFLFTLMDSLNPCPDCGKQRCARWLSQWFLWVTTTILGEYGMVNMFLILLLRQEGGAAMFDAEELSGVRGSARMITCTSPPVMEGERPGVFKVEVTTSDEEASKPDNDWPDLL